MKNKSILSLSMLAAFLLASGPLAWSTTCTTSSETGQCPSSGAYASSTSLSESNGYNTYVDNDVWGGVTWSQTLTSTSPESWYVSANIAASTSRVSFPYTTQTYASEAVSSFTNIVGTFNETTPHNSSTEEQASFDIYLNSYGNEVQIQHDIVNEAQCNGTTPVKTSISFGGSYGVPTESWDLCLNGSIYYWQWIKGSTNTYGESSGSVEIISMLKYLETNGYLPSSSTMSSVAYGFIIDTTSATAETFTLNSFSLINNASGGTTVATPTFSPTAGTYTTAQSVSISDGTSGATIYYTTNDTTPTTSSSVYSSAIDVSATETLEALATHSGDTNSSVGTAAYTISSEATVATPTFSPAAGTYTTAQSVSISDGTSGATIYYTTNDTTPTTNSSVYSSAIDVSATETLEALATHSGDTNSAVGTAAYTISSEAQVATPTFSPAAGTYTTAQSVSISDGTSGATIYYTTNDTTPTTSSSVYSSAIDVSATETLEALATHSGDTNSAVGTAAYTINSGSTCELTTSNGVCPSSGLYYDTSLSPVTWGQITQNDVWGSGSVNGSWTQDLYTTSPGDWYVVANFPSGGGGEIFTFPDAAIQYYDDGEYDEENPTLDSFTEIVSAFNESVPSSSTGTVSDIGYDMWFNDWASEVMIQHQVVNTPACTTFTTVIVSDVEFGGSDGVPDAYWNLCQNGTFGSSNPELIWQYDGASGSENFGVSDSSVDVYHMLKYLEGNSICKTSSGTTDCLPTGTTLTQISYGFEISTTDGANQTFTVNSWTQTAVQ